MNKLFWQIHVFLNKQTQDERENEKISLSK